MPLLWFLAGVLTTFASIVVSLPWLRGRPKWSSLPALPWTASVGAVVLAALALGSSFWSGRPVAAAKPTSLTASSGSFPAPMTSAGLSAVPGADGTGAFGNAAKLFGAATGTAGIAGGPTGAPSSSATPGASSMDAAIASLEARLAKGGGTTADWELLAKSFEFLGRPADAAKARAKQLPALSQNSKASAAEPAAGAAVSGEVTLAAGLSGKAAAGETLFIIAKSVDSPGIPVAVFRGSVGGWPLKFTLDDSQSMMPGRNLSSAGRVTIEARISQKGQPLPAAGDLQGSSGPVNPADHQQLKILIDRVIT